MRAANATILSVPSGHCAPFPDQHETVVEAEVAFHRQRLTSDRSREASVAGV